MTSMEKSKAYTIPLALSLLIILSLLSQVYAKGDVNITIVSKMADSHRQHNYKGITETRTIYKNKIIKSRALVYNRKPYGERIEYLDEPIKGLVIGTCKGIRWRLDPSTKCIYVSPTKENKFDNRVVQALKNHNISVSRSYKIANRNTFAVVIKPKNNVGNRKKFWVDTATFVALKSEEYDNNNKLISSTTYTTIEYPNKIPDKLFEIPCVSSYRIVYENSMTKNIPLDSLTKIVGFKVLAPGYLPHGFKIEGSYKSGCPCGCKKDDARLIYTNGVSSISVEECLLHGEKNGIYTIKHYGGKNLVRTQIGALTVTIIGPIPTGELTKILHSMH